MRITKEWLKEQNPCNPGYKWFIEQSDTDHDAVIAALMKINRFDWANWLIVRLMDKAQKVKYACHASRLALPVYEKYKPGDNRPRKAIEAAESGNAAAATAAADAASDADYATAAYSAAAYAAAAAAAGATAVAERTVADTAAAADAAAAYAAYAYAAYAASAASAAATKDASEIKTKIINYGLSLIK